jgi:hypothetical protein
MVNTIVSPIERALPRKSPDSGIHGTDTRYRSLVVPADIPRIQHNCFHKPQRFVYGLPGEGTHARVEQSPV